MRVMLLARSSRSLVALVTAVLLLLCQTAFAAQACAHSLSSSSTALSAPCHGEGEDISAGSPLTPASVSVCESAKAVSDSTKVLVYALADLPAVPVAYSEAATQVRSLDAPRIVHAVCHSPPLNILHCRLLN